MKQHARKMDLHFMVACFLFWLAGIGVFFMPTPAICDNSVADEIISLNVTDRPLGEVLEHISIAAGCQFRIDESWEDYPITVSFDNEPLYRGLKLIFRDINNAVIYGVDRTVKIIIYDEDPPSGESSGQPVSIKSSAEPLLNPQPSGEATAPQPEAEVSEDSRDAENVEQPSEEVAESDSDTSEVGADSESDTSEAGAESGSDTSDASADGSSEEEKSPAGEGEESEPSAESSEKDESTESNEETSNN